MIPIGVGLLMCGVFYLYYRSFIRFKKGVDVFQQGHLDYQIGLHSNDELGELSKAIDEMAQQLAEATQTVHQMQGKQSEYIDREAELQKNEDYFRRLFEYSNDAVFIYDFEGTIQDVNNKACEMLGYPKKSLLKIPFLNLQPEEEQSNSKAAFRTSTKTGSIRYESVMQRKDSSLIFVEISSSIVDLKKGIMQSIVSNITQRKEIEESLRMSEEKFRTFMETASDLMFITDADGKFTYVNLAMANGLGYTMEEIIGMPFHEVLDRDRMKEAREKREKFIDMGEDIHELVWETKNRRKIYGEMKAMGIFNQEGKFKGIRGVFRDITERKKIEESQRLTQLGKFAADMAHEVKNQMMIIGSRAKIALMRKPEDPELLKDLTVVTGQCERVDKMVKRLLMFSKPSKEDYKETDINKSVDFVVDMLEHQFSKDNVKIEKNYNSSLPLVKIDEKQMQEVYMNLMGNAFEAMQDGGIITISTKAKDDYIQIDITDNGEGISEEDLQKIFDPFFTTKEKGTGLGLSACYGIIKAHDGELKYTSKKGEGTTATITLPLPD